MSMIRKIVSKVSSSRALIALTLFAVVALSFWGITQESVSQNANSNVYDEISIRTGVWNNGQAAFWDLPFLDHFIIFGAPERARGWKPDQPIKFSHVRHVQKNKMDCQYCHWTVNKSPYAAIPEVETCVGCHKFIQGGSEGSKAGATEQEKKDAEDAKAQIKILNDYYARGESIPWAKVHVTPDYVRFNHKRHVGAGVGCQECHGQVPMMEKVERVTSMKMGWCLDCHRSKGANIDCTTCHK